ncbi:MAG TPA: hypothetical protein VI542_22820, partial [Candidatus Tectomicrobia bacterium]
FVPLDEGLAVLSRHAQGLGYDAVVLFLDELILWLASQAADLAFVNREGQKIAKLVEAMSADRPIPIGSFIARQRDLRELVGDHLPGTEQLGFADVLNWWQARFDTITLEDRNLPAIVEKRLLRPKSTKAARQLREAFDKTSRVRDEVFNILLTRTGDRDMFRQVYPFSPALVQTLVALSALLQRERTALKLMLQLLVNQRDSLVLGDLVPVGDLFDVIAEGDEPFTQAIRLNFDTAQKLYRHRLLPRLVWLPAFFTRRTMEDLGRLGVLDYVLTGHNLDQCGSHLSQLEREQARVLLHDQRDQMRQRLWNAMLAAYGVSTMHAEAIDTSHDLGEHFYALTPTLTVQPPVGASLKEALHHLCGQALACQFPAHPQFTDEVRRPALRRVLELIRQATRERDGALRWSVPTGTKCAASPCRYAWVTWARRILCCATTGRAIFYANRPKRAPPA